MTMVATLSGSRMICAWSTLTVKVAASAGNAASMVADNSADAASRLRRPNTADIELSNATHATKTRRNRTGRLPQS